ncbi:hypothetical protein Tco_0109962, partial [Tanacetum coccineum]
HQRTKVTTIEESKDLTSLSLDELIGNLKVSHGSDTSYIHLPPIFTTSIGDTTSVTYHSTTYLIAVELILLSELPPRERLLLTTLLTCCEVGESSAAAAARQPGPTMAHIVDYSLVDTMETMFRDTEKRMMTALEMVNMRVSYQVDVRSRESLEFYSRHHDVQKDCVAVRAEIEVLRRERLAYEQESMETRQALARPWRLEHALTHWRTLCLDFPFCNLSPGYIPDYDLEEDEEDPEEDLTDHPVDGGDNNDNESSDDDDDDDDAEKDEEEEEH